MAKGLVQVGEDWGSQLPPEMQGHIGGYHPSPQPRPKPARPLLPNNSQDPIKSPILQLPLPRNPRKHDIKRLRKQGSSQQPEQLPVELLLSTVVAGDGGLLGG